MIYRNRLIELIQYAPTTETVRPEPILIVPAWIMKYYILDLSPENSLVRYLTEQGFTVFMISWKNPTAEDRDLGMDDYRHARRHGRARCGDAVIARQKVHAVGYCLGGTLLAIAAAAMARDGDERLKTLTLLAAQADFTEAGELTLFINESQVDFLEDLMWSQGYLDTRQMAGAFQLLRSNDLIWSRIVRAVPDGRAGADERSDGLERRRNPHALPHAFGVPATAVSRQRSRRRPLQVDGRPIAISDIRVPIFAVGTERDHVAPWRSAFKIHLLADTDVTFLLTTGGHNAGIVSEPGHGGRSYRVLTKGANDRYLDPDAWWPVARKGDGSWWPEWVAWLAERSGAPSAAPPNGPAPG